jgi:hypothetical protein
MTAKRQSLELSREERHELDELFHQIKSSITASSVHELERFTDLFAKTLIGKGDEPSSTFGSREN